MILHNINSLVRSVPSENPKYLAGRPLGSFWDLWKRDKESLKKAGVVVSKDVDYLVRWPDTSYIAPSPVADIETPRFEIIGFDPSNLLPWQPEHAKKLIKSLLETGVAEDNSDTGTGKTYSACAVAKHLNLKMIVLCPKAVRSSWKKASAFIGSDLLESTNYEQIKTGKTAFGHWEKDARGKDKFVWTLPENALLIFDEVHRCKGLKTDNAELLISATRQRLKRMLLSATLGTTPLEFRAIGYALGLHNLTNFYAWAGKHNCRRGRFGFDFFGGKKEMLQIRNEIGSKMSRVKIADLGAAFPENSVFVETLDISGVDGAYKEMERELADLQDHIDTGSDGEESDCILTVLLRARQKIELLRVPALVDLANDELENGRAVVVFCSFHATLDALAEKLSTNCIVKGGQTDAIREGNIADFQSNKSRVILCQIGAGGVGISLHDLHGIPRTALICPTWRADELKQALGRIWRAEGKSKAIQKFCFAAGGVEEQMAKSLKEKVSNLDALNDGALLSSVPWLLAIV